MKSHNVTSSASTTAVAVDQEKQPRRFGGRVRTMADIRHSRGRSGLVSRELAFFRETWLDLVTLFAVGVVTVGLSQSLLSRYKLRAESVVSNLKMTVSERQLWTIHPTRARRFPITFSTTSGDIAGLLCALAPIGIILLCQLHRRIHSFEDATYAILGLVNSVFTGTLFQAILKTIHWWIPPTFPIRL
jgi:hypothetical protein